MLIPLFSAFVALKTADDYFEISKNIDIFISLYKEVNTYYVDPVDPGKLMKKAIDEMLKTLDPYTNFISESEIEDYRFQVTGQYGGIGAVITTRNKKVYVSEPYESYPAEKAGLWAGDEILEADGKSVAGKTTAEMSKILKGQPGSKIKLKLFRQDKGEFEVELIRAEVHIKNVPYFGMINSEIGYIKLRDFRNEAANEVAAALQDLKKNNPGIKGIVLDLRGNPGGLLIESVNVLNVFVSKNILAVSTLGKVKEWDKKYFTMGNPVDSALPVAVLINRRSASASEIVSGGIQDLDRGIVVGQRSFGKGLVQSSRNLSYNTQVKVTTAKYYTPSGRCIQALDYSHRNEDGSVGEVPDSLKKTFKTRNGRKVKDGGGVEPDVKISEKKYSLMSQVLLSENIIFDFASQFRSKNPKIANPESFRISDEIFESFIQFTATKTYTYTTQTEKALEEFKKKAEDEKYFATVENAYISLKAALTLDKQKDIRKNQSEIRELLENEIVKRYYLEKGAFQHSLQIDPDVIEAQKLLRNPQQYQSLLQPK